jgi:hypothetical protein
MENLIKHTTGNIFMIGKKQLNFAITLIKSKTQMFFICQLRRNKMYKIGEKVFVYLNLDIVNGTVVGNVGNKYMIKTNKGTLSFLEEDIIRDNKNCELATLFGLIISTTVILCLIINYFL